MTIAKGWLVASKYELGSTTTKRASVNKPLVSQVFKARAATSKKKAGRVRSTQASTTK